MGFIYVSEVVRAHGHVMSLGLVSEVEPITFSDRVTDGRRADGRMASMYL